MRFNEDELRRLMIESLDGNFVDMYISKEPITERLQLFVKTKTETHWDEVNDAEMDKVRPYLWGLGMEGALIYLCHRPKGEIIDVR